MHHINMRPQGLHTCITHNDGNSSSWQIKKLKIPVDENPVEQMQHLKLPYDWQEFPRPPEILPTSSNQTSPNVTHPMTTMTTKTMMMTTTATVERTQHWKIPNDWIEYPRPTEMIYLTKPYLPHTDIDCTAKLCPNLVPPQQHSTNTNCHHHITAHCTTYYRTTDYRKLTQQAFYHKANLRPP